MIKSLLLSAVLSVSSLANVEAHYCACRDCYEVTYNALCDECARWGCDHHGKSPCRVPDAYAEFTDPADY